MINELISTAKYNIVEVRQLLVLPVLSVLYLIWDRVWFGKKPYEWDMEIDKKIPVIPWTVFIYNSWYPSMILIYFLIAVDHKDVFYQLIPAYILVHIVSFLFYMFFQNKVVRGKIPGNGFASWVLNITRHANNPYNGCPSVHVSTCTLTIIASIASGFSPVLTLFIVVYKTAIIISTLTTEQHVFIDVVWGVILGIAAWFTVGLFI